MKIFEGIKVELRPSPRKRALMEQHAGLARFVWNWALGKHKANGWPVGGKIGRPGRAAAAKTIRAAEARGESPPKLPKRISAVEMSRMWTQDRKESAPWSVELTRNVSTYVFRAMDEAYKHAFRRKKAGAKGRSIGWPKFKSRRSSRRYSVQDQSFRHTRWAIRHIKIGMIPIRNARRHDPLDRLVGARVLRLAFEERASRWFCSIMVEREVTEPPDHKGPIVGLDLGYSLTLSDGTVIEPPRSLDRKLELLRRRSRQMSRKKQGSERWKKAKRAVAQLHFDVEQQRTDWLHKVSDSLTRKYGMIVTEGFDVRRFVQHEVASRRNRRTILDIGWGRLRTMLDYKSKRTGTTYLELGKKELTDQSCSRCGALDERRDGMYRCPACGHLDTRPKNTADFLERFGRGDPPTRTTGGEPVAARGGPGSAPVVADRLATAVP